MAKRLLFGGIEGGGTKFICAVGIPGAPPLESVSIPTAEASVTLDACVRFFQQAQQHHGPIAALGMGCFGPLQLQRGAADYGCLMDTPKAGWSGVDLLTPLRAALGIPVMLDTDVAVAALAEWQQGAGRGLDSLVYVTVGTGIGGALAPAAGRQWTHAEIGHVPLRIDDRDMAFAGACPFHGRCAEGLASGPAIRARWGCDLEDLPAVHWGREVIAGYLGQLAATLTLVLSPHCLVFGGGVMNDGTLLPLVRAALRNALNGYLSHLRQPFDVEAYVRKPGLGARSGVEGALLLAQQVA